MKLEKKNAKKNNVMGETNHFFVLIDIIKKKHNQRSAAKNKYIFIFIYRGKCAPILQENNNERFKTKEQHYGERIEINLKCV